MNDELQAMRETQAELAEERAHIRTEVEGLAAIRAERTALGDELLRLCQNSETSDPRMSETIGRVFRFELTAMDRESARLHRELAVLRAELHTLRDLLEPGASTIESELELADLAGLDRRASDAHERLRWL